MQFIMFTHKRLTCRRMKRSEGDGPDSMSGSCGTCVDGVLYLFGGHHTTGNTNLVRMFTHLTCRLEFGRLLYTV